MFHIQRSITVIGVIFVAILSGCTSGDVTTLATILSDAGDEESNVQLSINESYDAVRNGARLILAYDAQSKSFKGTVENTTNGTLRNVRVEVHLSNGTELGPTTPVDLPPGARIRVQLAAAGETFDRWTAHPEVDTGGGREGGREAGSFEGIGEHGGFGGSGEGGGEHGGGGGNHN